MPPAHNRVKKPNQSLSGYQHLLHHRRQGLLG
jgi:hypothetical protein